MNLLPYEIGSDGHVEFPEESALEERALTGNGIGDVLFFRHSIYNHVRALEFTHAYLTYMMDHSRHDVAEKSCLEDAVVVLLAQMFEGHPLVAKVAEGYEGDEDDYVTLDQMQAVQETLMMQTMMGFAEFVVQILHMVSERENFLTHKSMEVANGEGPVGAIMKVFRGGEELTVPEDRMNMLHQPALGWLGRMIEDYQRECAGKSDEWVKGPRHMWAQGVEEREMCQYIRQFSRGTKLMADGRVLLEEEEGQ